MTVESFGIDANLDHLLEHTLYRAIQELLNNAIKHALADSFTVQLIKGEQELTLMVEDNGHGFELSELEVQAGGGINNIRSRVEKPQRLRFSLTACPEEEQSSQSLSR